MSSGTRARLSGALSPRSRPMMRRPPIPWLVLAVSLLLTAVATWTVADSARVRDEERFTNAIQSTRNRIAARLETYVALLRGGAGLFAASEAPVRREHFRAYTDLLGLQERYPGVQGVGFSRRFAPDSRDSLVAAHRRQGFPDFRVWPDTSVHERHAIVYLEPLDRRNRAAVGYDMFTEPTRRAAMAHARDTGQPAMSGGVTLVQEIEGPKQAGFLIYFPVYRGGDVPPTEAARRALLEGFVYAPFRADDLFAGIFGTAERPRVAFRIYDGERADPEHLLHASATNGIVPVEGAGFRDPAQLSFGGRTWTITFAPTPFFASESRRSLIPFIAVVGLMLSLVLFGLSRAQVRVGAAVRESERRMRAVLESLPVGVFVAERNGRIVFSNSTSRRIWALDEGDAPRAYGDYRGWWADTDRRIAPHEWGLARALRGETVAGEVVDIEAFDGTRKTILNAAFPLHSADGAVELAVASMIDITEQRRAQEAEARAIREQAAREAAETREGQLRLHAAALERSNRELQDFAYVASHDLQEPLRKITTFSGLAMEEYGAHLDATGRAYLQRVQDAALRMSRLIRDLLAFSRVETRKLPFERIALTPLVADVLADLEVLLDETGGRVEVDDLPAVEADPVQMRQLFQNLLGNALKFQRPGIPPVVRVRGRVEHVSPVDGLPGAAPEQVCRIEVEDNGIGFDEKYLDRIFAPFQRLHGKDHYEGTGIGLAICRRIVERYGGSITAKSTPGDGSTFVVRLPLVPAVDRLRKSGSPAA